MLRLLLVSLFALFIARPKPSVALPPNVLVTHPSLDVPIFVDVESPSTRQAVALALAGYACILDGFHWHYSSSRDASLVVSDVATIDFKEDPAIIGMAYPDDNLIVLRHSDGYEDYLTMVHEIGHLFGLEHNTEERSVMHADSDGDVLTRKDLADLARVHPWHYPQAACWSLTYYRLPQHSIFRPTNPSF